MARHSGCVLPWSVDTMGKQIIWVFCQRRDLEAFYKSSNEENTSEPTVLGVPVSPASKIGLPAPVFDSHLLYTDTEVEISPFTGAF
ncbi:hypothetical protein EJB05_57425 [Eragrostis curvula]|uniref:Uncharacterized protein n=1 Tax=Eragrostis curvula TaxID=38414 RepID=A0A5J9SGE7_9POAL|nr:hypothetical protein EJB05_57425 [Eragrostis curvula]